MDISINQFFFFKLQNNWNIATVEQTDEAFFLINFKGDWCTGNESLKWQPYNIYLEALLFGLKLLDVCEKSKIYNEHMRWKLKT